MHAAAVSVLHTRFLFLSQSVWSDAMRSSLGMLQVNAVGLEHHHPGLDHTGIYFGHLSPDQGGASKRPCGECP
jgi:hypothetical protein